MIKRPIDDPEFGDEPQEPLDPFEAARERRLKQAKRDAARLHAGFRLMNGGYDDTSPN